MTCKKTVKIFTLTGLAKALGSSYGYLRQVLIRYQDGAIQEHHGYRFFGQPNKAWFAYKADDFEIEIVDAPELLPERARKSDTKNKGEDSPDTEPVNDEEKPDAETPTADASDAEAPSPAPQQEG